MRVLSVKPAGKADVYNMEVKDVHDFVIQGGVVVHNCADEWRYLCMMRPVQPMDAQKPVVRMTDPLDMFTSY